MDLSLDNNINKLVLLIVCGCIVLIVINVFKKSIGKQLSVLLSLVVIVVVGYLGYVLLNDPQENSNNNFRDLPIENFNPNEKPLEFFDGEESGNGESGNGESVNEETNNGEESGNVVANGVHVNHEVPHSDSNNVSGVYKNDVDINGELNCLALLPADTNSEFAQNNPNTPGDICVKNFLNSAHHIGVNTQGCSLRNANRGLRSEPPNPQVQVSPWLQSTICPDLHRKPLDSMS
tara:strand:- start:58 stop:759 length:702 start_codon:yes stop_codon:yes gene_type:complete